MPGKQAKILTDHQIEDLLFYAAQSRHPIRNQLIVCLSIKAGLRAAEIAKLRWDMVLDADDKIGTVIELRDGIAKRRGGRLIPMHPCIRNILGTWRTLTNDYGPIIKSERGAGMEPGSIVLWFARAYRAIGLAGCSSHSGRRTFITRAARLLPKSGGSLRDVQLLAGL